MKICTTVNEEMRPEVFSRGKYLILYDLYEGKVVHKEENPALLASTKRPEVVKRCLQLGADVVGGVHGSFCIPAYLMSKGKARLLKGGDLREVRLEKVGLREVIYSSKLAMSERKSHREKVRSEA